MMQHILYLLCFIFLLNVIFKVNTFVFLVTISMRNLNSLGSFEFALLVANSTYMLAPFVAILLVHCKKYLLVSTVFLIYLVIATFLNGEIPIPLAHLLSFVYGEGYEYRVVGINFVLLCLIMVLCYYENKASCIT